MDLAYIGTDAIPAVTRNCITATQICSTDGIASITYGRGFCRNPLSLDIYIGRLHRRRIHRRVMRPRLGAASAVSIAVGKQHPTPSGAHRTTSRLARETGHGRHGCLRQCVKKYVSALASRSDPARASYTHLAVQRVQCHTLRRPPPQSPLEPPRARRTARFPRQPSLSHPRRKEGRELREFVIQGGLTLLLTPPYSTRY